ncbi:MAG: hypothetical protein HY296_03160 [Thaumarchaeota archaeon]|nr:hypothetical protein [Nitrososphaerota archaeon]
MEAEEVEEEKETEEHVEYTPVVITPQLIAEQVYSPVFNRAWYLARRLDSEEITRQEEIRIELRDDFSGEITEKVYKPLVNRTLTERLVLLPDGYKKATFGEAYAEGCRLALDIYDASPGEVAEIKFLVGITQSSWFLDRYFPDPRLKIPGMGQFAPIIPCRGMSGGGKDRLMNGLRLNSYRPFYDVATTRAPSLYRPLDQWKGTLCMSEADFHGSGETAEVMKYLNCRSYGVPYSRQSTDTPRFNDVFGNFGLTIVSQRRPWEDNATEDRSLPHYCEKSQNPIPTEELPEWIERGIELQCMLLYLRLMHWDKVSIDRRFRIREVRDHRLTAAILPLQAISKLEPAYWSNFNEIITSLESRRREVKALSPDGVILGYLWNKIDEGLIDSHNGKYYIGKERFKGEKDEYVVPLQTSDMEQDLNWKAKELRRNIHSLQLTSELCPARIRIGPRAYRPIWVSFDRLDGRLYDFVPSYDPKKLREVLRVREKDAVQTQNVEQMEQVEQIRQVARLADSVPDVPHVPRNTTGDLLLKVEGRLPEPMHSELVDEAKEANGRRWLHCMIHDSWHRFPEVWTRHLSSDHQ